MPLRLLAMLLLVVAGCAAVTYLDIALGQDALVPAPDAAAVAEPTPEEWAALLKAAGGAQGLGTLGLVGLGVQGLLLLARSRFSGLTGRAKIGVVFGLTMIAGPLGLILGAGVPASMAISQSAALAVAQVGGHQAIKKLLAPKPKP